YKTMTLDAGEFMRRFLLHVLPRGFHRIRHYGFMANADRKDNLATARALFTQPEPAPPVAPAPPPTATAQPAATPHAATFVCPHCGAPMIVIAILARQHLPRAPP
ncbi:MAG: transposase, partial [Rhodanobacteraceae bacterium]